MKQGQSTPYQSAVLRYHHSLELGERLNIGVVLWVPTRRDLISRVDHRFRRLSGAYPGFNGSLHRKLVGSIRAHFQKVAYDRKATPPTVGPDLFPTHPSPDVKFEFTEILNRLIEPGGAQLQWSTPMSGATKNVNRKFEWLFETFVGRLSDSQTRDGRTDEVFWTDIQQSLVSRNIRLTECEISVPDYKHTFKASWTNGTLQCIEPMSFEYQQADSIEKKASQWCGRLLHLKDSRDFKVTPIVAPPRKPSLRSDFERATRLLAKAPHVREIFTEDRIPELLEIIQDEAG